MNIIFLRVMWQLQNLFTTLEHVTVFLKAVQWLKLITWQKYPFQIGLTLLCVLLQSRNAVAISQFLSSWCSVYNSGITNSFTIIWKSYDCEDKQCYLLFSVFLILLHWIFQSSSQQTNYLLTKKTNKRVNHINQTASLKIFLSFCTDASSQEKKQVFS